MAIISGGQTLSTANLTDLLDGGASTLHSHAASAAFPAQHTSTVFEAYQLDRWEKTVPDQGNGYYSTLTGGMRTGTDSSNPGHMLMRLEIVKHAQGDIFGRKPTFRCNFRIQTLGTDFTGYCGIAPSAIYTRSSSGSNGLFIGTPPQIGFKFIRTTSGTISVHATQGDETTENASSSIATIPSAVRDIDLAWKVTADSGFNGNVTACDFYTSIARAAWSSATELTSNGPPLDGSQHSLAFGIGNNNTTSNTEMRWLSADFGGGQ